MPNTTPTNNIPEFLLEADVHTLLHQIETLLHHIKENYPHATLYYPNGEVNMHTRWGAILFHSQTLRATIRAFI